MTRSSISDFSLANPVYVGSSVSFYQVDDAGARLPTLAPLYEGQTGSGTLTNPQVLDSDGKFERPVYIDQPVIAEVSGAFVGTHETGVIAGGYGYRGEWQAGARYLPNDIFLATGAADGSGDLYIVSDIHTSGVFADDLAAAKFTIVIDVSVLADQFSVPATGGNADKFLRVNPTGTAYIMRTVAQVLVDIGAEPANADILKKGVTQTLEAGFPTSEHNYGTITVGQTLTLDLSKQRLTHAINGGAFTLAADATNDGEQVIYVTNNASAGAVTLSGLTLAPDSGAFDAADGNVFRCFVEQSAAGNFIWIEAMQ